MCVQKTVTESQINTSNRVKTEEQIKSMFLSNICILLHC